MSTAMPLVFLGYNYLLMKNLLNIQLPELKKNISTIERLVSVLGGSYLLYDSLRHKRGVAEYGAAGFMLFRGLSGYCPASHLGERILNKNYSHTSNINIHTRMVISKPVDEVYNFWRHLGNLPLFMEHLESVAVLGDTLSEWKAILPGGLGTVKWKAEIVAEEPYRFIGWQSLPGSKIKNAGKVQFKDAGELGTLVHVVFSYHAPLGSVGEEIARLLTPTFEKTIRKDILAFKRFMETGVAKKISQETNKIYM
ncbi:Cyclase/dehydrase [Flavobacterium beibuense]|uniref:Cyclase/dehydrase n=2 Tax=Flavobacterium beibuense TaxID=657326 RepID=A0A444W8B3_9FLAO|nr:Cyclase/dehydrase [Flavobacterium beibuense]